LAAVAGEDVQHLGDMLAAGDVLDGGALADGDGFAEQLVQGGEALGEGGLIPLGHEAGGAAEEVVLLPQLGILPPLVQCLPVEGAQGEVSILLQFLRGLPEGGQQRLTRLCGGCFGTSNGVQAARPGHDGGWQRLWQWSPVPARRPHRRGGVGRAPALQERRFGGRAVLRDDMAATKWLALQAVARWLDVGPPPLNDNNLVERFPDAYRTSACFAAQTDSLPDHR